MKKFKIDYFAYSYGHVEGKAGSGYSVSRLTPEKTTWGRVVDEWKVLQTFTTRQQAKNFVAEIRDLPEYL